MLPLHYLAQWGPSEAGVLDMVLVSTGSKTRERDGDGNTAEVLAMNAEYENCREVVVVAKIREFRMRRSSGQKGGKRGAGLSVSTGIGDKYSSFDDVTATAATERLMKEEAIRAERQAASSSYRRGP